ncbi:hypothetical protein [Brevibacterium luteolum]|uniref:Uncharacterized protein n=1 Tax=Brevibacterium luteolum TaxID=199591 RepID=A0A849ARZ9_9MICO|nr:hypothetical protein [Brevibacterium luteolum]MBM7528351.1 UDP-N-acetylmuramyl pentapeptide phosphotransferase/UDP-N-acetylglucosamine-1-phosphate transferase [Brevibacterium luteolum]NNG79443.1 hypothetical protein [Brevibacterium luteolum]
MIRTLVTASVAAVAGYAATRGVIAARDRLGFSDRLDRTNHAGETVSLIEGPAAAVGATTVAIFADPLPHRLAATLATTAAGVLGAVDDFAESGSEKGLRGHLSALARGEVTTGGLKILGISASSVVAALIGRDADELFGSQIAGSLADAVLAGGVIAGTANLINLLDLRPARALKASATLAGIGLLAGCGAALVLTGGSLGVVAAAFADDAAGLTMLGDTGANALGSLLGTAAALDASRTELALSLALLAGLTLASEKVSFTEIIESTPGLRELDAWARVH